MSRLVFELVINIIILMAGSYITYSIFKLDVKFSKYILNINLGGLFPVFAYMLFIILVFLLDFSDFLLRSMIFFIVIFAMIFYVLLVVKDIKNKSVGILKTLLKIGVYAIYICIFFGFVYFSIYIFGGEHSYSGYFGESLYDQIISFMYFSFVSFNTIGYGDITPTDSFTRLIVIIQSIMYFIITLYAFSSISIIREKLSERENMNKDNNESINEKDEKN